MMGMWLLLAQPLVYAEVDVDVLEFTSVVAYLGRSTCGSIGGRRVANGAGCFDFNARVQQAEALSKQLRSSFLPTISLAGSMNTQPRCFGLWVWFG